MAFEELSDMGRDDLSEGSMKVFAAVLYLGLATAANAQSLGDVSLEGDMRKLAISDRPQPLPPLEMQTPEGGTVRLEDHAGRPVVLNFWATWCAPCREEMPALDRIAQEGAVEVLTVATGRNTLEGIERFYEEEGISNLPILLDPDQSAARAMAVLGLPVTVLIDAEGREVARLTGGAEWDGAAAAAVLDALAER
jgi:thiol-disulfide isomerase/thioredoxin